METKTEKRIVSRGAYVQASVHQAGTYLTSCCQLLLCGFFRLIAAVCGVIFLYGSIARVSSALYRVSSAPYEDRFELWQLSGYGFLFLVSIAASIGLGSASKASLDRAETIDPGVPLTRHNVADLPAPDSLVRASSEPMQAQQAVLLRAAAQGQETLPEQLVRASVRQE